MYLEAAGDQARARHGQAAAVIFYHEAVELLDRLDRALDAARVREELGLLLHAVARLADAMEILERSAEAYRVAGDLEAHGRVVVTIGWVHSERGTGAEGLARLDAALGLLSPGRPSRAFVGIHAMKSGLLFHQGLLRDALAATEEAERAAALVDEDEHLAYALMMRGSTQYMLGRPAEGVRTEEAALPVAERAGAHYSYSWVYMLLGLIHQDIGSLAAAREATERSIEVAERHGLLSPLACAQMQRGWIAFLAGEWEVARRDLKRARAIRREIGYFWVSVYRSMSLGCLCLTEGADVEVERHLDESERLLRPGDNVHAWRQVACVLAARDLLTGRPHLAKARLSPLLDDPTLEHYVAPAQSLLAAALLALGDVGEAAELAHRAVARARDEGRRILLIDALRVAATVEVRQRQWEVAEAILTEGLSLARSLGHSYGEAMLLEFSGELFAQTGRPEAARERRDEAQALFQRLGARPDRRPVVGLVSWW